MAGSARKIGVEIVGDASSIMRAFHRAGKAGEGFGHKMGRIAKGVGLGLLGLGTTATVAFTDLAIHSVKAAASLQQSMFRLNVAFGKNAAGVRAWSESLANSMGLSQDQAASMVGTMGTLFRSVDMGTQQSAAMSTRLVKLAVDMAAFNKASPEDTFAAIQKAMGGAFRGMKQYGVLVDATKVKEEALRETGKKSAADLTTGELIRARFNLILKASKQQDGAFQKQAHKWPGIWKRFHASIRNLEEAFGKGLLPVVTKVANQLANKFAQPKVQKWVEHMSNVIGVKLYNAFMAITKWFKQHWPGIKAALRTFAHVLERIAGAVDAVAKRWKTIKKIIYYGSGAFIPNKIMHGLADLQGPKGEDPDKHFSVAHVRRVRHGGDVYIYLDGKLIAKHALAHNQRNAKNRSGQTRGLHGGQKLGLG